MRRTRADALHDILAARVVADKLRRALGSVLWARARVAQEGDDPYGRRREWAAERTKAALKLLRASRAPFGRAEATLRALRA